jgi:hypothetical protein
MSLHTGARATHPCRCGPRPHSWAFTALAITAALAGAGCGDPTGHDEPSVLIMASAGARQFAQPGSSLVEPLRVVVTDAATGRPVKDVQVTWRVVTGAGSLSPATATTDALGVAATGFSIAPGVAVPTVRVEASARGNVGSPAMFEVHLVGRPTIASIAPGTITAGADVTITGQGFLPGPADNSVLFGGIRGIVMSAQPDRLVVTAPQCLQDRTVDVRVQLGQVASAPRAVQTVAPAGNELLLERGEVARFTAAEVECVRFAGEPGALYLAVSQNASDILAPPVTFELIGTIGGGSPATLDLARAAVSAASDWELRLRRRERTFSTGARERADVTSPQARIQPERPPIGDRRQFNVLNEEQETERATAELRAISGRTLMYVDVDVPANGFTDEDLRTFGQLFDAPIYPVGTGVFGQPTDIDSNGAIIILFTPRVNALTERGEDGFIAGYFYGCDLVLATRCAATNRAEIFYSMVPDPDGHFSDRRTRDDVLRTVPGILAHEFQHMIHFGRKGALDVLWLSEGLAHAAEELTGRALLSGDDVPSNPGTAEQFRLPNFTRAHRYLQNTAAIALLDEDSPGTLELRGAAWLFVEYLRGQFGGEDLLRRLTDSPRDGVPNVTAETGESWDRLVSDFAIALWADEAPELFSVPVDARFTFRGFDVRRELGRFQGGFGLRPVSAAFQDFLATGSLATSAHSYLLLNAPGPLPPPFSLSFTGLRGASLPAGARPQLTILRIR